MRVSKPRVTQAGFTLPAARGSAAHWGSSQGPRSPALRLGLATQALSTQRGPKFQTPERKAERFSTNHITFQTVQAQGTVIINGEMVEILLKSQIPRHQPRADLVIKSF